MRARALAAAALLGAFTSSAAADSVVSGGNGDWQATLDRVAKGVVVLRVSVPRAFDTDSPAFETATGFVVDGKRGIIVSNRHVVKPGPAVAEAVFLDNEEVPVEPIYRDPVHDFGFFRYDPAAVKFMVPESLLLAPENARVGTEIRVVGNDAGEKLSILAGTLARLDRDAPDYGRGRYNDFNTFYFQAASSTSGGSSGSPVVDVSGRAVALNAGGSLRASSSYYLPLDRVVRALALVRKGEPITRGTLQAVFRYRPYDELRRLGLRQETEERVRRGFSDATGMLVVEEIVPGGPAAGALRVGDVLVRVNGRMLTSFLPLEDALDASVGGTVRLEVERGGVPHEIEMTVQDLFEITPDEYMEVGGAVVHLLSYQQARNFSVPAAGLYLASDGYMFSRADVPRGAVLTAVGGVPVETLDDLEAALSSLPDGERVPVRYFQISRPHSESVGVIRVDRRWYPMRRCARDASSGRWPCTDLAAPGSAALANPATASFPEDAAWPARRLARSLVMVDFDIPFRADGVHGDHFRGTGLVVDAEKGLVVVDRETVPISLGDVYVTFGASVQVPGEVVFVHPSHNFSVVSYDPALVGDTPVRAAKLRRKGPEPGDAVWLVGLSERDQLVTRKTRVSRVEPPVLALTDPPRFRESNLDLVAVADTTPTVGGVLSDRWGRVYALWAAFTVQEGTTTAAFWGGIPAGRVLDVVTPLREGRPVNWRSLGVELSGLTLADARSRGLDREAANALESRNGVGRDVLSVLRSTAGTPAAELFEEGDLLLSVAGEPAGSLARVERASQAETVGVSVLRDGEQVDLEIPTASLDGSGTDRVVIWAGALLQAPHLAVAAQRGIASGEGVYVSWFWYGSPANRYGVRATRRIVDVDGVPTPDLDAFLAAVADRPDRGPVRLRTWHLDGKEEVITLKLDLQFWPTVELRRTAGGWERIAH